MAVNKNGFFKVSLWYNNRTQAGNGGNRLQWKIPSGIRQGCVSKRRWVELRMMDAWNGERPRAPLSHPYFGALGLPSPFVSNHISKRICCRRPLCTAPRGSQLCCLNSYPRGGERQQMGLGQRADASDSKRPGCWVEAASVRKLLFPWEPTNHWRKLKMSPLRSAIKSSKKLQLCRWCAAVCLFGC